MATILHPDRFETWANGISYGSMAVALVSFYQHNALGFMLGVVGLVAGAVAIWMSLQPQVRRDFPSTMAICGGVIGVLASLSRLAVGPGY